MNDAGAGTLLELYERQIAGRGFRADPAQLAIVGRLEALRSRLITTHRSSAWLGGRLLRAIAIGRRRAPAAARGLYLWGPVGRGKTWLMDLFFQSLPFPERRRRHFHRFMHDVHAQLTTLGEVEAPLERVAERLAAEVRVLCFDELFVTDIADAMILGGLFGGLFRRGVTLVVTSNLPPGDLYRNGLQRQRFLPAIELIERHVEVVAAGGDRDYRLRQLTQAGTYLPAGDSNTGARLCALFAELSDHADAADGTAQIEGHPIPVVRQSEGAVWFEFEALCAGPRSQDDYIEIARNYESVVVSGVPVMDALHEDEARRFIALVDELYDRSVKLVVSAAAPPVQLYRGERLVLEFQRTMSRLTEMQSEEYLAREHRG
ncbi:MAG: cell division protein ZapE [Steroidobacteraceae bacterium]